MAPIEIVSGRIEGTYTVRLVADVADLIKEDLK